MKFDMEILYKNLTRKRKIRENRSRDRHTLHKGGNEFSYFSRRMRWAGHVARMGEERGVHRVLVGKPEGKRPLGRSRRRWEDNIKMELQEVGGVVGTGWSWLRIGTGGGHL